MLVNTIISNKQESNIDSQYIDIEEIIAKIRVLINSKDPLKLSKEIEELRVIFYKKIKKIEQKIKPYGLSKKEKRLNTIELTFKKTYNSFKRIKKEYYKKKIKEEEKNLTLKYKIIENIHLLTKKSESLKVTFKKFKEFQNDWKNIGLVPITKKDHLWETYNHHIELFYDYIQLNKDLRDLDFQRNKQRKEEICLETETLFNKDFNNKIHEQLQKFHEAWKQVGPVEKKYRKSIWERFQKATKKINKKINTHFLEIKEESNKNLKNKISICKKINALTENPPTTHKEWQSLMIQSKDLVKKWKKGQVQKRDYRKIRKELEDAIRHFNQQKNLFYKIKKKKINDAIKKRISICMELEKLANNTDWETTTNKIIKLQKEWIKIDFIPKNSLEEKTRKKFKNLCNNFFNAKRSFLKTLKKQDVKVEKKNYRQKNKSNKHNLEKTIKTLKAKHAQYVNNISFFGKNTETLILKKEMKKRTLEIQEEIKKIEKKLILLNQG